MDLEGERGHGTIAKDTKQLFQHNTILSKVFLLSFRLSMYFIAGVKGGCNYNRCIGYSRKHQLQEI